MNARNTALIASLVVVAVSLASMAADTPVAWDMFADGEVQIAIDGSVSDYRLQSKLPTEVADLVDRGVRGWHFEPIVIDGKAVVAKTAMHMRLSAEPAGAPDRYRFKVVDVKFGGPRQHDETHPPFYPQEAVQAKLGAKVMLAVQIDDQGQVTQVAPYQTSLDMLARSERQAEAWRKLFERASVAAARSWRFDLSETINGKPIPTVALVPVVFSISNIPGSAPKDGQWKAYVPGPVHEIAWFAQFRSAANGDVSAMRPGDALSLDSRFHLKDDVVGKTL
jgi:hypothetical protein